MFITNSKNENEDVTLSKRLRELMINSDEFKFLVGFFYFSSVKELYESLKDLDEKGRLKEGSIKILVGMNIDKGLYHVYEASQAVNKIEAVSRNDIKKHFLSSVKNVFTSKELDKEELYNQITFFLKLLRERKIILRKTRKANHAKVYLFKMNESVRTVVPNLFITGSSNLTMPGLLTQDEFNVEIKDYGFEEAEKYFDTLWEDSVEIEQKDVAELEQVIKKETFLREATPFEAYAYLIKTYIDLHSAEEKIHFLENFLREKKYEVYQYQLDAVAQAKATCEAHNGVIIADVVGLGKSIIASMVARMLNKNTLIITPPHLIGEEETYGWKKYVKDFELKASIFSTGKLEEALDFTKRRGDIEVVIVDEAHRFRNSKTKSYHILYEICRGKTVILLTATPFNNRPSDIFSLIKLFVLPQKSTISLDKDIESRFADYQSTFEKLSYIKKYYNSKEESKRRRAESEYFSIFSKEQVNIAEVDKMLKNIATDIKSIISPVVIRRNRIDLQQYKDTDHLFSKVNDPKKVFFELTKEQSLFYDEVIKTFATKDEIDGGGGFKGAVYFPESYVKSRDKKSDEYVLQENLYNLLRRLVVKRFESSSAAFIKTIERLIDMHQNALEFIKRTGKFMSDRKFLEDLLGDEDEESFSKKLAEKHEDEFYEIKDLDDMFIKDIESDLEVLKQLNEKFHRLNLKNKDPKLDALISVLEDYKKKGVKAVVFTEYRDTAKYLYEKLSSRVDLGGVLAAFGNITKEQFQEIAVNFDYKSKGIAEREYSILISTDKLSEGFNLNKAGVVINYDIPFNPVRVIQRAGRVNRVGKVHEEIDIINFFPTERGEDVIKSENIAKLKMFMIHKVLGEDSKVFDEDEEPQASELFTRLNSFEYMESESFITKLKKEYQRLVEKDKSIEERIKNMPNRVKVSKEGGENELIVFIKKGKELFVKYKNYDDGSDKFREESFEKVYEKIKATENTASLPLSKHFWSNYSRVEMPPSPSSSLRWQKNKKILDVLKSARQVIKNETYIKFIDDLIEDVKYYGTLQPLTLSKIGSWSLKDVSVLEDQVKSLMEQLGEDFLEVVKNRQKEEKDEEVIMAIENQKSEVSTWELKG